MVGVDGFVGSLDLLEMLREEKEEREEKERKRDVKKEDWDVKGWEQRGRWQI